MEKIKKQFPNYHLLLTFFSPSGYEVQKNYAGADWVFYLPLDGAVNARRFLEIVEPALVIFVKYEFWYYYLKKIKYRNIPLLLVSALFRKDMSFFKWYGALQRKILSRFDQLFVQNESSKKLIEEIGLGSICTVSGDTRFDRVIEIAERFTPVKEIESFLKDGNCVVAGSTWPEDEKILSMAFAYLNDNKLKLVIAPHEINESHIQSILSLFPDATRFSKLSTTINPESRVLIIDNIGMLSRLYHYADITYVGGGFRSMGVHNVLEAAVYNKVVLFGPRFEKYTEAIGLVQSGGGIPVQDPAKDGKLLMQLLEALLEDKKEYDFRCKAAGTYVNANRGATDRIINYIQENRLLTN